MDHPLLYEINTRCWLRGLSDRHKQKITLANVPEEEFALWQRLGFTHIWLMGVWTTGPRAIEFAINEPNQRCAYDEMIPGWTEKDIGGSPYSIAAYEVPESMGGESGLKKFREELNRRGMKLILDFVSNHMGFDHPWLAEQPGLFVQSPKETEGTFAVETASGLKWIANAKDPYFPHWADVAQLDFRKMITHIAMQNLLLSIAARCDGVRCDMAMLLLNEVFTRTWSHFPISEPPPVTEFWDEAIPAVKRAHPKFIFMAEVYWGLESRLQSMGFNYTYDKQLYDDLHWHNTTWVQKRLLESPPEYVASSVHFLENHDEPRAAYRLSLPEHRAAALTILGLPGMRFLHDGQLTGAQIKIPVQIARPLGEPVQVEVQQMYDKLLTSLKATAVGHGRGEILVPRAAWPDNPTGQNFIIVQWQAQSQDFDLVVVNLAPHRSQCFVPVTLPDIEKRNWTMRDLLGDEVRDYTGSDLTDKGVYFDLPEHGTQLLHFTPVH